jgi:hypothetical protein
LFHHGTGQGKFDFVSHLSLAVCVVVVVGLCVQCKIQFKQKSFDLTFPVKMLSKSAISYRTKMCNNKTQNRLFPFKDKIFFLFCFLGEKLASVYSIFRPVCCELDSLKIGFN